MSYDAAFAGMKVIDLSGGVAGPSCAMMLAQHGADVIKVETPHNGGDWSRILGRTYEDHSAFSLYGTLGKRSLALDLKTPEGKEILWRLVRGAGRVHRGLPSRHHPALRLRLRRGQGERAWDHLLLDLRLRPDRPAGGASGNGSCIAGLHRHRHREQGRARQPSAPHRHLADRHVLGPCWASRRSPRRCTCGASRR